MTVLSLAAFLPTWGFAANRCYRVSGEGFFKGRRNEVNIRACRKISDAAAIATCMWSPFPNPDSVLECGSGHIRKVNPPGTAAELEPAYEGWSYPDTDQDGFFNCKTWMNCCASCTTPKKEADLE